MHGDIFGNNSSREGSFFTPLHGSRGSGGAGVSSNWGCFVVNALLTCEWTNIWSHVDPPEAIQIPLGKRA